MKKASDNQISELYKELNSCRKVAEKLGMCPQSVHERLKRLGLNNSVNILTDEDKKQIKDLYDLGFKRGDGKVKSLALKLNRSVQFICRFAKSLNLTNSQRDCDELIKKQTSIRTKLWYSKNNHPKGMLGKKHSKEVAENMSIRMKKLYKSLTPLQKADKYKKMVETQRNNGSYNRSHGSWSSAWRTVGEKTKFFRSTWEANYARYLQFLKEKGEILDWDHEPQTFWFLNILRGVRSYLPDFKIINLDGTHFWTEVKGWMDARSKTKIKRFAKYYPEEKLVLIQASWFKLNAPTLKNLIPDWE